MSHDEVQSEDNEETVDIPFEQDPFRNVTDNTSQYDDDDDVGSMFEEL